MKDENRLKLKFVQGAKKNENKSNQGTQGISRNEQGGGERDQEQGAGAEDVSDTEIRSEREDLNLGRTDESKRQQEQNQ